MSGILKTRWQQKYRTLAYPHGSPPVLPSRYSGRPLIDRTLCPDDCRLCAEACPTAAIRFSTDGKPVIDLGHCLFGNDCQLACPHHAISHSDDYRLAVRTPEQLVLEPGKALLLAESLGGELKKLLGRSLKLRVVSAGGCGACEADVNVLGTLAWDLGRFGIQFVASPRHADGLLITGPVTGHMEAALRKTYDAVPSPKIVIAVGACAITGGLYAGHSEVRGGAASVVPVDLFIPGCPPHPLTILDGLLRLIGQLEDPM